MATETASQATNAPDAMDPVQPNCPRCKGVEFSHTTRMFASMNGFMIYCKQCGAVLEWVPKPDNKQPAQ